MTIEGYVATMRAERAERRAAGKAMRAELIEATDAVHPVHGVVYRVRVADPRARRLSEVLCTACAGNIGADPFVVHAVHGGHQHVACLGGE